MAYTVKKLAKLSSISVRTLHYYDEINLLKPAYYGDNGYRYYEEEHLLMLQQILFFRELSLPLEDIRHILGSDNFNKMTTLKSHRQILLANLKRTKVLLATLDKTIAHLRGKTKMKLEEIFDGFTAEKQSLYENFLVTSGVSEEVIAESKNKINDWKKEEWLENKRDADNIHAELVAAIKHHLLPSSAEVQKIIKKHYTMTTVFWTPTKETYIGLGQLYGSHPDFVAFYERIHPQLLTFLVTAMTIFAENELT